MKFKSFPEFVDQVNELARKEAAPFVHHPYPSRMLEGDYNDGLTPKQVISRLNREAEAEMRAEARMS